MLLRLRPVFALLFLVSGAACAAAPVLTPKGKAVRIVPMTAVDAACEYTGMYVAEYGANFTSYTDNLKQAETSVRNDAGVDGATHLVIDSANRDRDQSNWAAALSGPGKCENCVKMQATGYRCAP